MRKGEEGCGVLHWGGGTATPQGQFDPIFSMRKRASDHLARVARGQESDFELRLCVSRRSRRSNSSAQGSVSCTKSFNLSTSTQHVLNIQVHDAPCMCRMKAVVSKLPWPRVLFFAPKVVARHIKFTTLTLPCWCLSALSSLDSHIWWLHLAEHGWKQCINRSSVSQVIGCIRKKGDRPGMTVMSHAGAPGCAAAPQGAYFRIQARLPAPPGPGAPPPACHTSLCRRPPRPPLPAAFEWSPLQPA